MGEWNDMWHSKYRSSKRSLSISKQAKELTLAPFACTRVQIVWIQAVGSVQLAHHIPNLRDLQQRSDSMWDDT